ncbi:DUF4870 domain-containing protein [Lysobacter sp. TY2-98]|uniref:DUF4870 domain-containing protein n=1 Tax=Lysobacter sp. TY2-98 TaxID=2290922 RepID=UPI00196646C8
MSEFDQNPGGATPPPYSQPTPPPHSGSTGADSAEERNWAMLGHLSSLSGLIVPFGNVLGPLVVWQIKKDTMPFAAEQAKEAVNFNITAALAAIVASVCMIVLIGFLLLPIVVIAWLVLTVMAGMAASRGENYRYPFTLRLIN